MAGSQNRLKMNPRSGVTRSLQYFKSWRKARMEAVESGHTLHIPLNLNSLEAEFLQLLEAWQMVTPASLPTDSTSMSVNSAAPAWLLANLNMAFSQEGKHSHHATGVPLTAVWQGPTIGTRIGIVNTFEPHASVAGHSLGTSRDPNHIKVALSATPVLPRDLGAGTFNHLAQVDPGQEYESGYVAGWLGFLTTLILLLAGSISFAIALAARI